MSIFQTKEFLIRQDKCGMKVTTDAFIFGAIVAEKLSELQNIKWVCDIGTGTGLLSLILAQQNPQLKIEAIEVDEDAYEQACENFDLSKFSQQLFCYHTNYLAFKNNETEIYDAIISNPPFFKNSLQNKNEKLTQARHDDSLPMYLLLQNVSKHIKPNGSIFLLYPYNRISELQKNLNENNLYLNELISVHSFKDAKPHNAIVQIGKIKTTYLETQHIIYYKKNQLSIRSVDLLKNYYLYL